MIWPLISCNAILTTPSRKEKAQAPSTSLYHTHTAAADSLFQLPLGCLLNSTCVGLILPYLSYFSFTIPIFYISSLISLPEIQAQIFLMSLHSPVCMLAQSLQSCLWDPMDCSPPGSSVHGISPGKNTGVGCHALLRGIFLSQESNPCLLPLIHWR